MSTGIYTMISALRVQQLAAQIISNNIANAATPGYSRQSPILGTTPPLDYLIMGSGARVQVGTGVQLTTIERLRDEFLDIQLRRELSVLGQQEVISGTLDAMKALFPELNAVPGTGMVTALDRLFTDFAALAATPGGAAERATLLQDAVSLANHFNEANRFLRELQNDLNSRVLNDIDRVNLLLTQVAKANADYVLATAGGGVASQIADKRDGYLEELARLISINTVKMGDGSVMVLTGNNRTLVKNETTNQLVSAANTHSGMNEIGILVSAGVVSGKPTYKTVNITGEIESGEIKGLILAREQYVADEMLEIDELVHSLINQVNLLHRSGYSLGGTTTGMDFFLGSRAGDIKINPLLSADPSLVAASAIPASPANGEVAETLGMLGKLLMNTVVWSEMSGISNGVDFIDPTMPLDSTTHTALNGINPGAWNANSLAVMPTNTTGTIVINGTAINWSTAESLQQFLDRINDPMLGLGVRATFDYAKQRVYIFSDRPVSIYDASENLTEVLRLQANLTSLAAVNNGTGPLDRPLDWVTPFNQSEQLQRTPSASTGGTITVNGIPIPWSGADNLTTIVTNLIALPNVDASYSMADQTLSIYSEMGILPATSANPISSMTVRDAAGNLSMVFNIEAQATFGAFGETLLAQMQAQADGGQSLREQSEGVVAQLEFQRDAIMKVNLEEEKARLLEYARAYEAAVKALSVLDEMLNVLINKMAVTGSNSSGSAIS